MLARAYSNALANPLMRNFIKLFAGTAAAKALGFLAMPVVARLVTPEDFGEFSVFTAVVSVVAPLLALRYIDAIPIPKSTSRATQLLTLALLLIAFNATLLLATAWLLLDVIANMYSFIDLHFLLLVYFAVIALAVYEALNLWAVRARNYGVIARTQISQALTGALSKMALSYFAIPMGLMLGQVTQNLTGITSLLKTQRAPFQKYRVKVAKRLLAGVAKSYKQYPKYRLLSRLLLVVTQAIPVLMVGNSYGTEAAGQLGFAVTLVTASVMVVVGNVRKLYYGYAAKIGPRHLSALSKFTLSLMLKMAVLGALVSLIMFFLGEDVFVICFGERWRMAGEIIEIYSLYVFPLFLAGPFVDLLNILDKQKIFLIINSLRLVAILFVFALYPYHAKLHSVLLIYSVLMSIFYLFLAAFFVGLLAFQRERSTVDA